MNRKIRKLIPNNLVNYGKHLPTAVFMNIRYNFPSRGLTVIGVTGTDGKTTTVHMIYQILKDAGVKVSMVSSIQAVIAGKNYDTGFHVTTPDSSDIQKYIFQSQKLGDQFLILEVTSHALAQHRMWGINFNIGVITNITHEHLDYHKNFENYRNTKAKLIKNVQFAILNKDDPSFEFLSKQTRGKVLSFSLEKNTDINLKNFPLKLKVPGDYNKSNALAAALVAKALGVEDKIVKNSLVNFTGITGRMERIPNKRGINVIIDFAHTPNALEQTLKTLKQQTSGKLIAVFGAASERDVNKRPMMGRISAKFADGVILTDEDPRFEDSLEIIEQIAEGARKNGAVDEQSLFKIPDRYKAIKFALSLAKRGDTVGIFGKGHEKSMNYKGVEKPWSDKQAVVKVLG